MGEIRQQIQVKFANNSKGNSERNLRKIEKKSGKICLYSSKWITFARANMRNQ